MSPPPADAAAHSTPWPLARQSGVIYTTTFDRTLLIGPALAGLLVGGAAAAEPRLYLPLLFADLWLLGYHHVVATYTRMAFDRGSLTRHRFRSLRSEEPKHRHRQRFNQLLAAHSAIDRLRDRAVKHWWCSTPITNTSGDIPSQPVKVGCYNRCPTNGQKWLGMNPVSN